MADEKKNPKQNQLNIELPEDIAAEESDAQPMIQHRFRRSVPDEKIINQAFGMLKAAKRPVIIAGNGCIRRRASKQLRIFCEKTGIGVISTFMAKGCVDMDADYCLYTIGLGSKDRVAKAVDDADLIITLGFDMVEYHPQLWNDKKDNRILHIDFLPAEIDEHYHPETEVIGDLAHALWMLNEKTDADGLPEYDLSNQQQCRAAMATDFAEHKDDRTEGLIRPQKAIWDARQVMGPNDILLSDVGAHKMWVARHYQCHEPNTCLIPNGFCSMGFALPGAIAASMVFPERRILAIVGDAGFLMNAQEMETAKRVGSNITVMVWDDHAYGLIEWKQEAHFGRHTDLDFYNPDWELLAQAFGWSGHTVTNSADLAGTLEAALAEAGPCLVGIPIDYRENMLLTKKLGEITVAS